MQPKKDYMSTPFIRVIVKNNVFISVVHLLQSVAWKQDVDEIAQYLVRWLLEYAHPRGK